MDWLIWAVLAVFILFGLHGYRKGFIKIAYSLAAIILSIVLVSILTPYVKDALLEKTQLYTKLTDKCTVRIEENYNSNTSEEPENQQNLLEQAGIKLPAALTTTVNCMLQDEEVSTNLYRMAGRQVAMWILCAISFVLTLILVGIIVELIGGVLNIVTKLPVLHGFNRIMGFGAGLVQGLLVLWLAAVVLTVFCTSKTVQPVMEAIYANKYLTFLYENNGILYFISYFLI
ncbi:MAG: CvpA family protein [Lachnospiraceae bacterium]